jgi:hypothetical protein
MELMEFFIFSGERERGERERHKNIIILLNCNYDSD